MKRKFLILSVLAILVAILAANTLAYFTADTKAHNVITSGGVDIVLNEWANEDRTEPLKAGAMTEWNVWNFIGVDKTATSADIQKALDAGAITVVGTDGAQVMALNVLVEADGIQSDGFADAAAAWAAFDA